MNTTGWFLVVLLTSGVRADLGPQEDCVAVAREWMKEAQAWEVRTGVPPDAMWACIPPDVYEIVRVKQ